MPPYVTLFKFTDQGRRTVKDSPKRAREAMAMLEKAGIKFHQILYTTGQYDLVAITEAPNDHAALIAGLETTSQGNLQGETLHPYAVEEMEEIASKLP